MKKLYTLLGATILVWQLSACYYDVEEELYDECDPTKIDTFDASYANQVSVTLETYCLNCHSTANAPFLGSGIKLDSHGEVKKYAENGRLVGAITHASGYSAMPKGGDKIPECDIVVIEGWVNNGAPNN